MQQVGGVEARTEMLPIDLVFHLARAAEKRDSGAEHHMRRVGVLSGMVAEALGYSEDFCEQITKAAQLHDIGKIGVNESVLSKPGPLTVWDCEKVREHTTIGAGILSTFDCPLLQMAAQIAITHHEHFNGLGYPAQLMGNAIPPEGRIVGIVDFFDALTSSRTYRQALSDRVAMNMIYRRKGSQFDPFMVDTFMEISEAIVLVRNSINDVEGICDISFDKSDLWSIF